MVGKYIDRFLKKTWSEEDIQRLVGEYKECYLSYAYDKDLRAYAASGGVTSAALIHGLTNGFFEGAVVCKTVLYEGKVRPKFEIATTKDQILEAQGSKYVETPFIHEVFPLIKNFKGRVAVVGLPCDLGALKRRCNKDPEFNDKVVLTIGLVCGHNSRHGLIDHITGKLEKEAGSPLQSYRFRIGHWRGKIEAKFNNGKIIQKPTKFFNDYQNAFFFCERKCMACIDHFAYHADITVGDVWLFRLKHDPIKQSGLIIRTTRGENFCNSITKHSVLNNKPLDIRDILDGQSRIAPAHYNISARARHAPYFGIKLKDTLNHPTSWHASLNAFISIANMRLSEKEWGKKLIFAMPRPIIKVGLYFKKALESLK